VVLSASTGKDERTECHWRGIRKAPEITTTV